MSAQNYENRLTYISIMNKDKPGPF